MTMSDDIHIGNRIRMARLNAGMSQIELASRIGLKSSCRLGAIERTRSPHAGTVHRIATALGLPMEHFFPDTKSGSANEYQAQALRTANCAKSDLPLILNCALGLCGEAGEFADLVKKALFHGHPADTEHMARELGDVAWYLAVSAHAIGYDLDTILQMNVDKLRNRYPDGFDAEKSLHRKKEDV